MNHIHFIICLFFSSLGAYAAIDNTKDNTLIIGDAFIHRSFDPNIATSMYDVNVVRSLFEGLCSDVAQEDGKAYPGMATSWTHSADFKVWTFNLRKTNTWSDGKSLTATDFTFAYERILSPDFDGKYCSMLFPIENAEAFNKGEIDSFARVGVKALDPYTLQIRLHKATPYLPELVKHHTWFPVPEHVVLEAGKIDQFNSNWTEPENIVSNGPFILKSKDRNRAIQLVKNPDYWDMAAVKLDKIIFLSLSDTEILSSFKKKQIHVASYLRPDALVKAKVELPKEYRRVPFCGSDFIRCNVKGTLKNQKVRKAISLALPRKEILAINTNGIASVSLIPPFGTYKPPSVTKNNIAEAKKLMVEAGFPNGKGLPMLELLTIDKENSLKIADVIAKHLKQHLGITIVAQHQEWAEYIGSMANLDYDLATGGWIADYMDPTSFLNMWRTNDGNNRTGWSSEAYEKILAQANTSEGEKRMKLLANAEQLMLEEYPIINVSWYTSNYLVQPEVKGWYPRSMNNQPYKYLSLETAK